MIMKIDKQNGNVCYSDSEHVYWDAITKQKYISVTTLIGKYEKPFDKEFWSLYKALEKTLNAEQFKTQKKRMLETKTVNLDLICSELDIDKKLVLSSQQDILDEWEVTNKESTERGTAIHSELENAYYKSPTCNLKKYNIGGTFTCKKNYYQLDLEKGVYPEFLIYRESEDGILRLAGQIDLLIKDGNDIYLFDYKSNKKLDKKSFFNQKKKQNECMLYPLNDIMDCNFYHYTLQLSTYAWMIQKYNPNFNIKKLMLIHYDHEGNVTEHEVDYMKDHVERMLKDYKKSVITEQRKFRNQRIEF